MLKASRGKPEQTLNMKLIISVLHSYHEHSKITATEFKTNNFKHRIHSHESQALGSMQACADNHMLHFQYNYQYIHLCCMDCVTQLATVTRIQALIYSQ